MAKIKPLLSEREIELIKKIKISRLSRNMTQVELAKKANLTQAYIAQIEGFERNPSLDTIKKISIALDDQSIMDFIQEPANQHKHNKPINKLPIADYMPFYEEEVIRLNAIQEKTVYLPENTYEFINKFKGGLYYSYFMNDDSMHPEIKKGSNVIIQFLKEIDPYKADDFYKFNGSFVVLVKHDCETFIRKAMVPHNYKKNSPPILFHAINPDYYSYEIPKEYIDKGYGYSEFKIDEISKKVFDVYIKKEEYDKLYVVGVVLFVIEEKKVGDIF